MDDARDHSMHVGDLPVLSAGLNLAELDLQGGDGLWTEVQRFARASQLERQLDTAMGGRAAPRIWAFIEAPGAGLTAAAAALGAAWLLAERGQMVVLVDADEQEPRITRWLGRHEQEGWIDMVRFGASLQAASVPLPSAARRGSVLGVGTFAPTGITPDEVADLLGRLRRQADDLILVLPAKLRSQPWLEIAQIRLLCWDLLARGSGDTQKILAEMDRMGARPDALLGFGVEEYELIQASLREAEDAVEPAPAGPERPAAGDVPQPATDGQQPIGGEAPPPDGPPEGPAVHDERTPSFDAPLAASPAGDLAVDAGEPRDPAGTARPRPRTSRVFVLLAAAVVVMLALLGVFLRFQLGGDRLDAPVMALGEPERSSEPVVEQAAEADRIPAEGRVEPPVVRAPAESLASPAPPRQPAGVDRLAATEPLDERIADPAGSAADAAAPTRGAVDRAAAVEPEATAYTRPPGELAWSLWLFSLPTAESAEAEIRRLDGLGIKAAGRIVELPDQGRWWRIHAGNFASREEAREAAGDLLARLEHDWAVPVRY